MLVHRGEPFGLLMASAAARSANNAGQRYPFFRSLAPSQPFQRVHLTAPLT